MTASTIASAGLLVALLLGAAAPQVSLAARLEPNQNILPQQQEGAAAAAVASSSGFLASFTEALFQQTNPFHDLSDARAPWDQLQQHFNPMRSQAAAAAAEADVALSQDFVHRFAEAQAAAVAAVAEAEQHAESAAVAAEAVRDDGKRRCDDRRPDTCKYVECPTYEVLDCFGNGIELREYASADWLSVHVLQSERGGYEGATMTGFHYIFKYLLGFNEERKKVPMGSPVITVLFRDDTRDASTSSGDDQATLYKSMVVATAADDDASGDDASDTDADAGDDSGSDDPDSDDDIDKRRRRKHHIKFKDYMDVAAPLPKEYEGTAPVPRDPEVKVVHIKRTQVYARAFDGYATASRVHDVIRLFIEELEEGGHGPLDCEAVMVAVYDPPVKVFGRENEVLIIRKEKR